MSARNISGNGNLLLDYVRLYANETNRPALDGLRKPRVEAFHYDWGINDVHTRVAIGHSCPLCDSGKIRGSMLQKLMIPVDFKAAVETVVDVKAPVTTAGLAGSEP